MNLRVVLTVLLVAALALVASTYVFGSKAEPSKADGGPTATPFVLATATPAPTAAPAAPQVPAATPQAPRAPLPSGQVLPCPTDDQMRDAHGFTARDIKPVATGAGIPWEGCKWTLQSVGFASINVPMLPNWQYTVTLDDDKQTVAVFYGEPNLTRRVFGATLRFRPAHNTPDNSWVNDPCELLKREQAFGQMVERGNLRYNTVPGNVVCTVEPGAAAPSGSTATVTASWLTTNVGGSNWQAPTHAAGAWVFRDKGKEVSLKYPGCGKLDVWLGAPVSITADNASRLNGQTFDEASFHPQGC